MNKKIIAIHISTSNKRHTQAEFMIKATEISNDLNKSNCCYTLRGYESTVLQRETLISHLREVTISHVSSLQSNPMVRLCNAQKNHKDQKAPSQTLHTSDVRL